MFDIMDFFVSYVTSSFLLLFGWPFVDQAGWWICLVCLYFLQVRTISIIM